MTVLTPPLPRVQHRRPSGRDVSAVVVPAAVALLLSVAWSWRPSYWLDETATVSAVVRPAGALPALLAHHDTLHAAYYLLLWPWSRASVGEAWLGFPSAVFEAGAAAAVAAVGWQLFGRRAGLVGGLVYAVLPIVSVYGSTARSQALFTFLTAAATCALVRAARVGGRRWWVGYSVLMSASVVVFLFSASVLLAHAVYVLVATRRLRPLLALAAPALAAAAMTVLTAGQFDQIGRSPRPTLSGVPRFLVDAWFTGSVGLASVVVALSALGVVVGVVLRRRVHTGALVLAVGMTLASPVVLWVGAQVRPIWTPRYLPVSLIGFALLAGAATLVPGRPALAALVVPLVAISGTSGHLRIREPISRGPDYVDGPRLALEHVAAGRRGGDALAYPDGYVRAAGTAFPDLVRNLPDITDGTPRAAGARLYDGTAGDEVIASRLSSHPRVWVVAHEYDPGSTNDGQLRRMLAAGGYHPGEQTTYGRTEVSLWSR